MKLNWILGLALVVGASGARASYVTDVVAQMPAKNSAEEAQLAAKIMAGGTPAVKELCSLLVPLGTAGKDDAGARYAVSALVRHAGRPGGEADRAALVAGLCQALSAEGTDVEVRTFLVNRLQEVGRDDAIAAVAPLLTDEKLAPHAAATLERIGTPAAVEALAKALPAASGANRVALMKSLGMLRATAAAAELKKSATDDDKAVRMAALWALANLGEPGAQETIEAAAKDAKSAYDQSRLYAWDVLLVRRLAENGAKDDAAKRATAMMAEASGLPNNARIAAARTLAEIKGEAAAVELLAAADKGNAAFRAAIVDAVTKIPGEAVTTALTARLAAAATAEAKVDVLDALARRKDASAQQAVLAALKDADPAVRTAAIAPAVAVAGDAAIAPLIERVAAADETAAVVKAAAEALGRMPGDKALASMATALATTPAKGRVILLDVLAARATPAAKDAVMRQTADADPAVRLAALRAMEKAAGEADAAKLIELAVAAKDTGEETAALKAAVAGATQGADAERRGDAFVAALSSAKGPKRAAIQRAVAKVGGKQAFDVVVADLKSDDAATKEGALRALAEWQDDAALTPLLGAAKSAGPVTQQVIAIRGAINVLKTSKLPAAEKAKAYASAMEAAKRPEERKLILGALGAERGREAFDLAAAALDQDGLKAEAALAVIKIALPEKRGRDGLKGAGVADALTKAIAACPDKALKADAQRYLGTLK
jgi:HEAT repeat protein